MAFTFSLNLMTLALYVILPFGEALGIPILTIAIRRTTEESNRQLAYGMFYTFMNIGALLAGFMTDILREFFPMDQNLEDPTMFTAFRVIFLSALVFNVAMLLMTFAYKQQEIVFK